MKVFKRWGAVSLLLAIAITIAHATVTYVQSFKVGSSFVWILENTGATMQTGAQKFGNSVTGSAVTMPTTSTASNFSTWLPVYNPTSSSIAAGTVLVSSNVAGGVGYVNVAAATTDLTTVVGVAAEAIAAASKGWMVPRGGGYAVVLTTGTVTIGQVLVTTTSVAGYATGTGTPTTGADFGTALSVGTAAGGSVVALLH